MSGRSSNNRSSIYLGKDGWWHGRVSCGVKPDGTPDRRHVRGTTKAVVTEKVHQLEKLRDASTLTKPGVSTLSTGEWLESWLEAARPHLRRNAYEAYRVCVYKHAIPVIGGKRLKDLRPEHLKALYGGMITKGLAPATAHRVHEALHVAFEEARESGYLSVNPATGRIAPRIPKYAVEPFDEAEVQRILEAARGERGGVRWVLALALGLRQGELLALCWSDVDLTNKVLRVPFSRERPYYRHGCDPTCGKTPGLCPQRQRINPERGATKSDASRRMVGLPDPIVDLLVEHRSRQQEDRAQAGTSWVGGPDEWLFTDAWGRPLNNNSDHYRWKQLLKKAGVRDARLHDARHTAATMLLILGVPERAVIDSMGWSTGKMTAVYQHVTNPVRQDVADRVGKRLFTGDDIKPSKKAGAAKKKAKGKKNSKAKDGKKKSS